MFIPDERITDVSALTELLAEFDAYTSIFSEEMEVIWNDVLEKHKLHNEEEGNERLAETLFKQYEFFEVENLQLFGINGDKKVKLAWIED